MIWLKDGGSTLAMCIRTIFFYRFLFYLTVCMMRRPKIMWLASYQAISLNFIYKDKKMQLKEANLPAATTPAEP